MGVRILATRWVFLIQSRSDSALDKHSAHLVLVGIRGTGPYVTNLSMVGEVKCLTLSP
jgi:hypothetical protein